MSEAEPIAPLNRFPRTGRIGCRTRKNMGVSRCRWIAQRARVESIDLLDLWGRRAVMMLGANVREMFISPSWPG